MRSFPVVPNPPNSFQTGGAERGRGRREGERERVKPSWLTFFFNLFFSSLPPFFFLALSLFLFLIPSFCLFRVKKIDFQSPCSFKPHSRVREKRESRVLLQNSDERYFFCYFFVHFFVGRYRRVFWFFCGAKRKRKQRKSPQRTEAHTHANERISGGRERGIGEEKEENTTKKKNSLSQNPVSSIVDRPKPLAAPLPPAPPAPPFPASEGSSMYCDRIERTSAAIAALMRAR